MTVSDPKLILLERWAAGFGARDVVVRERGMEFVLPVPRPGGRAPAFAIVAEADGEMVHAREAAPVRLPAFCPERHINDDGSFCLGWQEVDDLGVRDGETAHAWWARLVRFLSLQERAAHRRRWPDDRAWPHGGAARHQHRAEGAATRLGPSYVADLAARRLQVVRKGRGAGGAGLRIMRDRRRVYAVWEDARRPVNLRRACLCPRGQHPIPTVLRSCMDHAEAAVELAMALRDRDRAEAEFWARLRGRPCCGTMDGCPLGASG